MLDSAKLWIGDLVKLKKSGRNGKYEGDKVGKARVNINGKIVITPYSNLELFIAAETDIDLGLEFQTPISKPIPFDSILDLHVEKLNPLLEGNRPERIRDYQIEAAKSYIEKAIKRRHYQIEIIHGKGTGVLKSEVHHLLSLYSEVKYHLPTRNGGGTEVLFQF